MILRRCSKYLPESIKVLLKHLEYCYRERYLDRQLLHDVIEFYNQKNDFKLNYTEALYLCRLGKRLIADFWNVLNPQTEKEIKRYYKLDPFSIFELVYFHSHPYQVKLRKKIIEMSVGEVLDYGGGIGDLALELTQKGLKVSYVDVESRNMEFAKALFKKYNQPIEVLDAEKEQDKIWRKNYDTIISLDVVEHLLHPESLLEKMAEHLARGGRLFITQLNCAGGEANAPMHLRINFAGEKLLNSWGLKRDKYDWLWIKR